MSIIDVKLYGGKGIFGGKETPLEAQIISCEKHDICSLFKNGQCRALRGSKGRCEHGKGSVVRGYTSRARKYSEFKSSWGNHEKYNALKETFSYFDIIDGVLSIHTDMILSKKQDHQLSSWDKYADGYSFTTCWNNDRENTYKNGFKINVDELTINHLHVIYNLKPRALFDDGEILSYKKEFLRDFTVFLKENLPKIYAEYDEKHGFPKVSYIGKKALLSTINHGEIIVSKHKATWDGTNIIVKGDKPIWAMFKEVDEVTTIVKPSKEYIIEITSNNQVNDKTVFVE